MYRETRELIELDRETRGLIELDRETRGLIELDRETRGLIEYVPGNPQTDRMCTDGSGDR